jgi:hypothetical protein
MDQAREDGLFHPNCLHNISLYAETMAELFGVRELPTEEAERMNEEAKESTEVLKEQQREEDRRKRRERYWENKTGKDDPRLKNFTRANAVIPDTKLMDYALNLNGKGKDKAIAFEKALGYNVSNANELKEAILGGLKNADKYYKATSEYGDKFSASMTLKGPNGKFARVMTGWILRNQSETFDLVSVYVSRRDRK